jgi:iron(III) transport system ATP-binding protein
MSITIQNLRKSFAGIVAVNDLTLAVPDGAMLVLLGPSGCGKTTTMRCIAGLERPDVGTIAIGGRTVFDGKVDVPINQRNVGMVFQSYAIWPHMSVFDNVAFPLRVKNLPRDGPRRLDPERRPDAAGGAGPQSGDASGRAAVR